MMRLEMGTRHGSRASGVTASDGLLPKDLTFPLGDVSPEISDTGTAPLPPAPETLPSDMIVTAGKAGELKSLERRQALHYKNEPAGDSCLTAIRSVRHHALANKS